MIWTRPEAWWWLALLVPLLLLHLHHRRRRTATVHGVWLWEGLAPRGRGSRGLRRLRELPALLVLAVAVALAAAAAAEPWTGAAAGPAARWTVVVDSSLSMRAVDQEGISRLERARSLVRQVVQRAGPEDEFTVWRAAPEPRLVVAPTRDMTRVTTVVDGLEPEWQEGGLRRTIELLREVGLSPDVPEERHVVVITDADGVARLAGLDRGGAELHVLRVGGATASNAGLRVRGVPDEPSLVELTLHTTDGPSVPRRLRVERIGGDGTRTGLTEQLLQPDEQGDAGLRVEVPRDGGVLVARLEPPDAFPLDDAVGWALPERRPLRVAVVHERGRPSPFLVEALRSMPDLVDAEGAVLVGTEAPADVLRSADVLVVEGVLPAYVPAELSRLVFRSGGTPRVRDPLLWGVDRHPVLRGVDLSPLRLEEAALLAPGDGDRPLLQVADGVVGTVREEGPRAIVLGFSPDATTLPLEAAYPVLLRNALGWLARRPAHLPEVVASTPVVAAAELAPELTGIRFDVDGEEPRVLDRAADRLPRVPDPVAGLPKPVWLGLGGTPVRTAWTWHAPEGLRLGGEPTGGVDLARMDDLPLRAMEQDTRRPQAPWFALAAAVVLLCGFLVRARGRGAPPNVDSVGGDF